MRGMQRATPTLNHVPVMMREVLDLLAPVPGACVVDATLGAGGHAVAILDRLGPKGRLIGIDRDPAALAIATSRLERLAGERGWTPPYPWTLRQSNFSQLSCLLGSMDIRRVDGILFDLGVSSLQLDTPTRGFSFREDGPLDMRMDPGAPQTAADLVNRLPEAELARLIWVFGEERRSRRIARRIVEQRALAPFRSTGELAALVAGCYPPDARRGRIHPATRTFQALRIAVNQELESLQAALAGVADLLAAPGTHHGGRLVVLAYHSLEDRIVKRSLGFLAGRCQCPPEVPACVCGARPLVRILTRKPVTPEPAEVERNPRARSARLRAGERL
jgi:16S rRNA (cytosine1402-N4)-methyltransferase